jgi:tRNA nucleotidyltransferase/poly(A) polymerase
VDFASCRRETYAAPAAYPRVERGTLEEDLFRRDFTVNAMAMALAEGRFGELVDPFHGARDLRAGRLRVLHAKSFEDDPSRILRGARFLVRFGLRWEPATKRALLQALRSGGIGRLNPGRLQRELDRMCQEPDPLACFLTLARLLAAARTRAR